MDAHLPQLAAVGVFSPDQLIETFGTIGLIAIVFAESCFAFFLPGDSLLFMAGFFSSQGKLNLPVVCVGVTLAAIAGNQVGYVFGRRVGPALFHKPKSRLFRQKDLEKTHHYFEVHGPKTIVLARFIPIVRTFACIIAGVAHMEYRLFLLYNVIGAVLWGVGITLVGWVAGRFLGEVIDIDKYLLPIIAVIIILSFLPVIIEVIRARRHEGNPNNGAKSEAQAAAADLRADITEEETPAK